MVEIGLFQVGFDNDTNAQEEAKGGGESKIFMTVKRGARISGRRGPVTEERIRDAAY